MIHAPGSRVAVLGLRDSGYLSAICLREKGYQVFASDLARTADVERNVARLAERRLPVYEYAPRRVKQAVCGHGGAGKQQVALLVSQILGIPVTEIKDDATDALAVAVCHAQTAYNVQGLLLPKPL